MAIHQEVRINSTPARVFKALMSASEFSKATGAPATISADEGGAFSCFDGQITGRNLELQANKMIVQAWRAGAWPDGVYSVVRMTLNTEGENTHLTLDHTGFPDGAEEHLESGWHAMYWEPLKSYCE